MLLLTVTIQQTVLQSKAVIHQNLFILLEYDIFTGSRSKGSGREANIECNESVPDIALRI